MASTSNTCHPQPCVGTEKDDSLSSTNGQAWSAVCFCEARFPISTFPGAALYLVEHPEYNSTLILRSEIIQEPASTDYSPSLTGYTKTKTIRRKLVARRPTRDPSIEQHCAFYSRTGEADSILVLTPVPSADGSLPYYHPAVKHIAFRYIASEPPSVEIDVVPLPSSVGQVSDMNSRLYRTSIALLAALHRYGYGAVSNYQKRVNHDTIIPREVYQDTYLLMRQRHSHLVSKWVEATDPLKHVFEDIGIATYLMLLWKFTYPSRQIQDKGSKPDPDDDPPWRDWGQPSGGFLDFGCGNGLLTHILTSEGYQGHGIDVRARATWSTFAESTRERLHVCAFDATKLDFEPNYEAGVGGIEWIVPEMFIIANHADELTPWTPILATLSSASGYISIPCCAWSFDSKFERSSVTNHHTENIFEFSLPAPDTLQTLNLGSDGNYTSSYASYRIWLAQLSEKCGWEVESDVLRIPSTRNWSLVGRRKVPWCEESSREYINAVLQCIRERGIFKSRQPEGKGRDH